MSVNRLWRERGGSEGNWGRSAGITAVIHVAFSVSLTRTHTLVPIQRMASTRSQRAATWPSQKPLPSLPAATGASSDLAARRHFNALCLVPTSDANLGDTSRRRHLPDRHRGRRLSSWRRPPPIKMPSGGAPSGEAGKSRPSSSPASPAPLTSVPAFISDDGVNSNVNGIVDAKEVAKEDAKEDPVEAERAFVEALRSLRQRLPEGNPVIVRSLGSE